MADGMEDSNVPEYAALAPGENAVMGMAETITPRESDDKAVELVAHHAPAGL
jgi:hypothetical protein